MNGIKKLFKQILTHYSMEKLEISFLGTSNAIPTKKRNHTAILVTYKNEAIMIDCGEGTQRQFKFIGISPHKLTKLLITHWHGDHILGIPGLFQTLAMSEYKKNIEIYGPSKTKDFLQLLMNLFKEFRINFSVKEISNDKINFKDISIESLPMNHTCPINGYSIIVKDKIRLDKKKLRKLKIPNSPLLGELQKGKDITLNGKKITSKSISYVEKGKKVAIILDTAFNENAIKLAENSDILICEATFSLNEEAQAKEYKHLTASQAATIAKKSKSKKLILTHISERYENKLSVLEKEAKKIFKNTVIAKDLDKITI